MSLLLVAALLTTPAPPQTLTKGGVTITWQVRSDRLHVSLAARTAGWVLMGVNSQTGLDGARLVFTRVRDGKAEAEVHRTNFEFPAPFHERVTRHGGAEGIRDLMGTQTDGWTRTQFTMPLVPQGPAHVPLKTPGTYHLILAWSVSDDFDHHSRQRVAATLTL